MALRSGVGGCAADTRPSLRTGDENCDCDTLAAILTFPIGRLRRRALMPSRPSYIIVFAAAA